MKRTLLLILCLATVAMTVTQAKLHAQAALQPPLKGYFGYIPWTGGTAGAAMATSLKGATIPLSSFTFPASKDGLSYTHVIVGKNPFLTTHRDESQNTPGSDGH